MLEFLSMVVPRCYLSTWSCYNHLFIFFAGECFLWLWLLGKLSLYSYFTFLISKSILLRVCWQSFLISTCSVTCLFFFETKVNECFFFVKYKYKYFCSCGVPALFTYVVVYFLFLSGTNIFYILHQKMACARRFSLFSWCFEIYLFFLKKIIKIWRKSMEPWKQFNFPDFTGTFLSL